MCDVSRVDWTKQHLCPEPEYRCAGLAGASGYNVLYDFCSGFSSSQVRLIISTERENNWTTKASWRISMLRSAPPADVRVRSVGERSSLRIERFIKTPPIQRRCTRFGSANAAVIRNWLNGRQRRRRNTKDVRQTLVCRFNEIDRRQTAVCRTKK